MHSDKTKQKQSESQKRVWANRTHAERTALQQKLSIIARNRWTIRALITSPSGACFTCAFYDEIEDNPLVGNCCRRSPPFPQVLGTGFCGDFETVMFVKKPRRKPEPAIGETSDPNVCEWLDNAGICAKDEPCSYRVEGWECGKDRGNEVVGDHGKHI